MSGIRRAQLIDFVEVDAGVIPIVIGEGDVCQSASAGALDPGWRNCCV